MLGAWLSGWVLPCREYGFLGWVVAAARPRLGGMVGGGKWATQPRLRLFKPPTDMENLWDAGGTA